MIFYILELISLCDIWYFKNIKIFFNFLLWNFSISKNLANLKESLGSKLEN